MSGTASHATADSVAPVSSELASTRLASARKRCDCSERLSSVTSSTTLTARRTSPDSSRTGVALMRDQRRSPVSRLR